jgi:hypothetical protein
VKADEFLMMAHGTADETVRAKANLDAAKPSRIDVHGAVPAPLPQAATAVTLLARSDTAPGATFPVGDISTTVGLKIHQSDRRQAQAEMHGCWTYSGNLHGGADPLAVRGARAR